jgi:hypothetical protein
MSRTVNLHFGEFSHASLGQWCERRGIGPAAFLSQAALYYLADRKSGRAEWPYPRFRRSSPLGASEVTVELKERVVQAAESEAERQSVSLDRLLEHAALYYLADLASGRVAARLAEAPGDEEPEEGKTA